MIKARSLTVDEISTGVIQERRIASVPAPGNVPKAPDLLSSAVSLLNEYGRRLTTLEARVAELEARPVTDTVTDDAMRNAQSVTPSVTSNAQTVTRNVTRNASVNAERQRRYREKRRAENDRAATVDRLLGKGNRKGKPAPTATEAGEP